MLRRQLPQSSVGVFLDGSWLISKHTYLHGSTPSALTRSARIIARMPRCSATGRFGLAAITTARSFYSASLIRLMCATMPEHITCLVAGLHT